MLTSFVLMAQGRMTNQADKRARLDLQVNLLAEQELTALRASTAPPAPTAAIRPARHGGG